MEYNEIIKLLDAGYSRDEIMAMQKEPEPPKEPEPKEPNPPKEPTDGGVSDLIKEMRDAFSEMRKEFTALNILSSRQPEEKTSEDIIASIINPTRPKKKGE